MIEAPLYREDGPRAEPSARVVLLEELPVV